MQIRAKIIPNSKKRKIEKIGDNIFEIKTKSKPENNQANNEVIDILSDFFVVPISNVRIIRGHRGRNKIIEISDR